MTVLIYDHGGGGFRDAAKEAAESIFKGDDVGILRGQSGDIVAHLTSASLIVCHLSSRDKEDNGTPIHPCWPELLLKAHLSKVQAIIRVSSQGAGGMGDSLRSPYRHNGTGPWILHLFERSSSVTSERWMEIFLAIKPWDMQKPAVPADIRAIFAPNAERYALRIMCEAWIATKGEEKTTVKGQKNSTAGDITVKAPKTGEQWLKPFGTVAELDQVVSRIGGGEEGKTLVRAVLEKAVEGKLSWNDSETAVKQLRDHLGSVAC